MLKKNFNEQSKGASFFRVPIRTPLIKILKV